MDRGSGRGFIDRVFSTYRPECRDMAGSAAAPEEWQLPDGDALAQGQRSDALVRYVLEVQPAHDALRRAIGHIGGLLVLIQVSGRRDALDRAVLAAALDQWRENGDRLGGLDVPPAALRHFAELRLAQRIVGEVLDGLIAACMVASWKEGISVWSDQLGHAYAHLRQATLPEAGLAIIDPHHSCCHCLRALHGRTPTHG